MNPTFTRPWKDVEWRASKLNDFYLARLVCFWELVCRPARLKKLLANPILEKIKYYDDNYCYLIEYNTIWKKITLEEEMYSPIRSSYIWYVDIYGRLINLSAY